MTMMVMASMVMMGGMMMMRIVMPIVMVMVMTMVLIMVMFMGEDIAFGVMGVHDKMDACFRHRDAVVEQVGRPIINYQAVCVTVGESI